MLNTVSQRFTRPGQATVQWRSRATFFPADPGLVADHPGAATGQQAGGRNRNRQPGLRVAVRVFAFEGMSHVNLPETLSLSFAGKVV